MCVCVLPAIGRCILLLLMPKMVLTLCKLRYMVVNLVISLIRTSPALLGILCSMGVCLVYNGTFTNVLTCKLGNIVVCGESVFGCVCVHVCVCMCICNFTQLCLSADRTGDQLRV